MVIERFTNGDAVSVYRRFRDQGRLAPEGLFYVSSWVDTKLERCYQVMETDNPLFLDEWIAHWQDVVDFEGHPVIRQSPHGLARRPTNISARRAGGRCLPSREGSRTKVTA